MDIDNITIDNANRKIVHIAIESCFNHINHNHNHLIILMTEKSSEMFLNHNGYFFVSESSAFN